jgi:hypothetical protein
MPLLDDLINAYTNGASQLGGLFQTPPANSPGVGARIWDALGQGGGVNGDSASQLAAQKLLAQGGGNQFATDPSIVQIDPQEAARAQAQQAAAAPAPTQAQQAPQAGVGQPPLLPPMLPPQGQAPGAAPVQAQAQPQLPVQQVSAPNVANVSTDSSFPSPGDQTGGLLSTLAGTAQQAAADPQQAKGLLSSLGDYATNLGSKLKNLSPAASQGLIASGLTILANNDGRHNLSQLVGLGGGAGLNTYQTLTQTGIANALAAQKQALENWKDIQTTKTAQQNADTEAFKARNPFITVSPGQSVIQAGVGANGQPGAAPIVQSAPTIHSTQKIMGEDGTTYEQPIDIYGNPVGKAYASNIPNVGALTPDQRKVINDANNSAATQATNVQHIYNLASKLSPTMTDPQTGQQVPNPDYVNIPGGLTAKGQDIWTKLTGNQTDGQVLRNQLQQQTYQDFLATWKPGIGGRLTNTDVNLLKGGMPPDTANGQTWSKFLQAYGNLQYDIAQRGQRQADFLAQNRGDTTPLTKPLISGGVTYPAGSTYQQVTSGQGGTSTQQPRQNGGSGGAGSGSKTIIAQAQDAARNGDTGAQQALRLRGLTW